MVKVKVRFVTLLQKYSGQRDIWMELPPDPSQAIETIITKFQIPWKDNLEKSTRIFINEKFSDAFIKSGGILKNDDIISLIPISGGG